MPFTKPNQELYEDLNGHAATIDWVAIEMIDIAKRINDAGLPGEAIALMEASKTLIGQYETLISLADDVQDGLIVRSEQ